MKLFINDVFVTDIDKGVEKSKDTVEIFPRFSGVNVHIKEKAEEIVISGVYIPFIRLCKIDRGFTVEITNWKRLVLIGFIVSYPPFIHFEIIDKEEGEPNIVGGC